MGRNSAIEWTHHTFNPWWGCAKVSPGCDHCYAETWAKRVGLEVWGPRRDRRFFGTKHWDEPLKWNLQAAAKREKKRVFCASMADVFEARTDLDPWRERLWNLISKTPWLDWLLLTKRPESVASKIPWVQEWPTNVWLGTTVEDQERANRRLPVLLQFKARQRFLSCEPLLGPLDLRPWIQDRRAGLYPINWVIAGGESGPRSRAMLPGWATKLRDQCVGAQIPFHFKQWGHWAPVPPPKTDHSPAMKFWDEVLGANVFMAPKGKKVAGRRLDGTTWDEVPVLHET